MQTEFLTSEEVLAITRVSKPTLTRWVREGFIPAYRFGRRLRFPKDEFEAWVEAQRADRVHTIREDKETEPVQEGSDGTYLLGSLERR